MIELKNVSKTFTTSAGHVEALKDINITINDGDIYGIIGMSGAGKSTLIHIISGLCQADSGKIYYNDKEITELSDTERAVVRNRYTGIVTQNCDLIPYLSVIENMKLA